MASSYTGEIYFFPYCNFNPAGFQPCNGTEMSVTQNTALFSLIGYQFGGFAPKQIFNVPDMRSQVTCGLGTIPLGGTITWTMGHQEGVTDTILTVPQYPAHNHTLSQLQTAGTTYSPTNGQAFAQMNVTGGHLAAPITAKNATMWASTITYSNGMNQAHENRQPFLTLSPAICYDGIYPDMWS